LKNGIRTLIFVFGFPAILENGIPISISVIRLSFSCHIKSGFKPPFSFSTTLENGTSCPQVATLENILDEVFVRRIFIEENTLRFFKNNNHDK